MTYTILHSGSSSDSLTFDQVQEELNRLEKEGVLEVTVRQWNKCAKRFVDMLQQEISYRYAAEVWNKI